MKVYREKRSYTTGFNETILDMEILDVIKSIGIRRDYALIVGAFSVDQFNVEKSRKNMVKCGFITLYRVPSAIEVYICQMQNSCVFSVLYNSKSLSCWKIFGAYFTGVPFGFDEYTFIGEV